jgi:hypothetical protein
LVPGCTSFDVQRTDDKTLVIQSKAPNIFASDELGPLHVAYAFRAANGLVGNIKCKNGDRHDFDGLTVEVLESDATDLASRVAFRFDTSLDSSKYRWLKFNWQRFSYEPFEVPAIGQSVTLTGPTR